MPSPRPPLLVLSHDAFSVTKLVLVNVAVVALPAHLERASADPDRPHNVGWRGIGGTIFVVDRENDFYMIYMEQKRGGPRSPFNNNVAQRVVYEAMQD